MNILAIDPGSKCGWALLKDGMTESGVQDFRLKRGESAGMRFFRFKQWLYSMWFSGMASQDSVERENLAWAAGFYDGEGSTASYHAYTRVHMAKNGKQSILSSDNISMGISQIDRRVLERFQSIVGGAGAINGPYKDKRPTSSPIWAYRVSGVNNVREILRKLWPWLGEVKKEQAEKALSKRLISMKRFSRLQAKGLIVYEAPHFRGGYATDVLVGMATRIQEFGALYGIEYTSVHSATLKKFATGDGRASKTDMMKFAKSRWPLQNIQDDNQADALWMAEWGKEGFGG